MPLILDYVFVGRPGYTGNKYPALIDTGAVFTVISNKIAETEKLPRIKPYTAKKWGGGETKGWIKRASIELFGAGRQFNLNVFVPDGRGSTIVGMDYMKLIGSELKIGRKRYKITPIYPLSTSNTPDIVTLFPPDVYDYIEQMTLGRKRASRRRK